MFKLEEEEFPLPRAFVTNLIYTLVVGSKKMYIMMLLLLESRGDIKNQQQKKIPELPNVYFSFLILFSCQETTRIWEQDNKSWQQIFVFLQNLFLLLNSFPIFSRIFLNWFSFLTVPVFFILVVSWRMALAVVNYTNDHHRKSWHYSLQYYGTVQHYLIVD